MSLWSCTFCSKSFTRKGDLTRHQLLHTGIKPHVCETCGKRFAQFSGLKTHWNVHTKRKPFICGIGTCTKAFGDPSSCGRHRKETHSREGAYKCIITDCGTRIKRRSAFVAHLRKHGLEPSSLDINAAISHSSGGGIPTRTHSMPANVKDKNHEVQSQSVFPCFLGGSSVHSTLVNSGETSHLVDGWGEDRLLDRGRDDLPPANNTLLPTFDQTMNVGIGIPHNVYPYSSSSFEDPFYFDSVFPSANDYPLLATSPLNFPIFESFLETAKIDESQSSMSTPSSTYSTLY